MCRVPSVFRIGCRACLLGDRMAPVTASLAIASTLEPRLFVDRVWIGYGSDMDRMRIGRIGRGSDADRMWIGRGSDGSDVDRMWMLAAIGLGPHSPQPPSDRPAVDLGRIGCCQACETSCPMSVWQESGIDSPLSPYVDPVRIFL